MKCVKEKNVNKGLVPCGNRLLVRREEETVTQGGIILPDSMNRRSQRATVIAVGSGTFNDSGFHLPILATDHGVDGGDLEQGVFAGDTVYVSLYAGNEVEYGGETLLIVTQDDILAIEEQTDGDS